MSSNMIDKELSYGKFVVCRCTAAGVHAGFLIWQDGQSAYLTNARRLWYWRVPLGAPDYLSGVATHGLDAESKVGTPVTITLSDVCEIIECSPQAQQSILALPDQVRTR